MKFLRIGTDRVLSWRITNGGEAYSLKGKDISLKVSSPRHSFIVPSDELTISDNILTWRFLGKNQKHLGPYTLTYIENLGKEGMISFDKCDAFALVAYTCQERGVSDANLDVTGIALESELEALGIIVPASVVVAGTGKDSFIQNGGNNEAAGHLASAFGYETKATGAYSHAEGFNTKAVGNNSHTTGRYTTANNNNEFASGLFNRSTKSEDPAVATSFSHGVGTSDNDRKNAIEVKQNGDIYLMVNGVPHFLTPLSDESINELIGEPADNTYPEGVFSVDFTLFNLPQDDTFNYSWSEVGFTQEHFNGIIEGAYNNADGFTIAGTVYPNIHVGAIVDEGTEVETYQIYSAGEHLFSIGGPNSSFSDRIGMADWG